MSVHHETIYNFENDHQAESGIIYDFIEQNAPDSIHKISKNKINLFGILKCLDIFENRRVKSIIKIVHSSFIKYIYSNVFPESFVVYLKSQIGF